MINNTEDIFLGCLNSSEYKNLSFDEQKQILIEKKIYAIDNQSIWGLTGNEFNNELDKRAIHENDFQLGNMFIHLENKYELNELFKKEFFEYIKHDAYASTAQLLDVRIKEINLHASHLANFGDLNEFYKEEYKGHYNIIKENKYFFIYNEPEAWHYPDWEYVVTEEICNSSGLIEQHLFCDGGYTYFEEISSIWQDLIFYDEILKFLKEKLNDYTDTSLSKLIFKENGEEIFNHIVLNYKETKKQAFFNYLYYFLRDELKKLKLEDEHSNTYTSYVLKKGYLKEYGRMQKARATNKKTHNRMMDLFTEMYSGKFEKTMSKDE